MKHPAVDYALSGGANGICLFNSNMMGRRHWKALEKVLHRGFFFSYFFLLFHT